MNSTWWNGGGLTAEMLPGAGNIWYVHGMDAGIGDNANDGRSPSSPFLTLTYAIAQCTAAAHDYIIVLDYWQPTGEVWPISVDVDNVHIIGAEGAGGQWPTVGPTGATAAISVAASYVEIARLTIHAGATSGCVENDGGAARWGTLLRDCWFGVTGTGQDGYRNATADNPYLRIKRCRFGQGLTRDGVRIEFNATRSAIGEAWGNGNLFDRVGGIGVNVVGNGSEVGVFNNIFAIPANTAGAGVTLSAGSTNCLVISNIATFGDTDMGNNPYADGAAGGANTWGRNFRGDTNVVFPT